MTFAVLAKFSLDFWLVCDFTSLFAAVFWLLDFGCCQDAENTIELKKFEITFNLMEVIDEDFFFFNDFFLTKLRSCG